MEKVKESQRRFTVEYLPLRRPLWNSPTVWESVRSKPTPLALIIFGLWPDWWKKTLLWRFSWGRSQQFKSELSCCLSCKAQDGTLLRTRPSLTSRHLSVQHSYQKDYCHGNNRSTPPNMHLPPCTAAAHTMTENTAVHARRAEDEHRQWVEDWEQLFAHWQCISCEGSINQRCLYSVKSQSQQSGSCLLALTRKMLNNREKKKVHAQPRWWKFSMAQGEIIHIQRKKQRQQVK